MWHPLIRPTKLTIAPGGRNCVCRGATHSFISGPSFTVLPSLLESLQRILLHSSTVTGHLSHLSKQLTIIWMPRPQFRTTPMELEATRVFLTTLRDPMGAHSCCARALQLGTTMLTTHEPDIMTRDARQTPIIRAIMHFLACNRSEEEVKAIKQKLNTCRCDFRNPTVARLHLGDPSVSTRRPDDDVPPPDLDMALGCLCSVVEEGLRHLPMGKFRKVQKHTTADTQPWPISQEDIIPHPDGTKGTVSALLRWATAPASGSGVFLVLGGIARFWEPFMREVLRTPLAFSRATDNLQFALDYYDPRAAHTDLVFFKNFHTPLFACANGFFLPLVVLDMGAAYRAMDPIVKQMMHITLEILPILRAIGPSVEGPEIWFEQMETSMKETFLRELKDPSIEALKPEMMFRQLANFRNLLQCMHLECTKPLGGKTAVCARCGIVHYCSPQRPAWRARHRPHKPLCDDIHLLRAALQLEDVTEWDKWVLYKDKIRPSQRAPDFNTLCKSKEVDSDLVLRIMDGLTALTEAKRAQLDELEKQAAQRR
ncbi:hypothetical protein FB451DRAFT_1527322 [Mycena latifolia]|nr:hypothetical protein FB451DRAFT_1527322 [Mycena latifolia]